jgi:hypothetical protein
VKAPDLFDAINTIDPANDNEPRGYVLIANATAPTRMPAQRHFARAWLISPKGSRSARCQSRYGTKG